jgi:hypothetical protein
VFRRRQFAGRYLLGGVRTAFELRDARRVDVETERREAATEFGRQRQADVTEADDADP